MPGTTAAALGQRIETARHAAGLTRRQVCDVSGVSISMIRKTEGGERRPSDAVLDALARAVQTTPEELLGGPRRTDSRVHQAVPELARKHLRDAEVLARRVRERLHDGTAVGPDSLEIHRLAVAVELGEQQDLQDAVTAATRWAPPRELPAERRSHYYIDLGRAHMLLGRPQHAKESLLVARRIAPQHVREHGQVRAEPATLVRLSRGRDEQLLQFARWAKAV
ncbi:helix-turn-helix domain-containing protein [Kitasatospora sp. NPDC059577]|uniref:helix-turn-helix domain-containing protein n=1 Tax=Kitasatospora sp. NPDC059577 TaxID=3346873 RepID=UPI0036BEB7A1